MSESSPIPSLSVKSLHWAAGFLEGEGSFGAYDYSPVRAAKSIVVCAAQKEAECLHRLSSMFGGTVRLRPQAKSSFSSGSSLYFWSVHATKAISVMMTLYPLLSTRRKQKIKQAIEHWNRGIGSGGHQRNRTHCKNGHPFDDTNTGTSQETRRGKSYIKRRCRQCDRERHAGQ